MVAVYVFRLHPDLKRLLDSRAEEESQAQGRRVTVNEITGGILAEHFGRPELSIPLRGTGGRPPKKILQ